MTNKEILERSTKIRNYNRISIDINLLMLNHLIKLVEKDKEKAENNLKKQQNVEMLKDLYSILIIKTKNK